MRKLALTLIFFLISSSAFAEFGRSTSFDDREICEKDKGVWREFGNSAVDSCESKLDKYAIFAQALTYACDCGKGRCWNGDRCVFMSDYKKIYDQRQEEEKKKLEAAKKARQDDYRDNSNGRLQALIDKSKAAGGDPKNPANNNMAQFYDQAPPTVTAPEALNNAVSESEKQAKLIADQSAQAAQKINQGLFAKTFSLPTPAPAQVPTPAPDVVPTLPPLQNSDTIPAGPTPFFLQQQEKAKQEANTLGAPAQNKSASSVAPASALPELPQIPLPQ